MFKTHPNFKSLDSRVKGADDIMSMRILLFMRDVKRMTVDEDLDYHALQMIHLDAEKVDRFYFYERPADERGYFRVFLRLDPGLFIDIRIKVILYEAGIKVILYDVDGQIFISKDPNRFDLADKPLVCQALREDGYEVRNEKPKTGWYTAPTLKFLCHKSIYQHDVSPRCLPTPVKKCVEDFRKKEEELRNGKLMESTTLFPLPIFYLLF